MMLFSVQLTRSLRGYWRNRSTLSKIIPVWHEANVFLTRHYSASTSPSSQPQTSSFTYSQLSKDEVDQLITAFPDFVNDVTWGNVFLKTNEVSKALSPISNALNYNVSIGKKDCAFLSLSAYKAFEKPENLTPERRRIANIMAWSTELTPTSFEMLADLVQHATVRRGAPCWYTKPEVGLTVIADAALMSLFPHMLLQKYFPEHPYLPEMIAAVTDVNLKVVISETIARSAINKGNPKLDLFTLSNFKTMTNLGPSLCLLSYPLTTALYMANIGEPQVHKEVTSFCEKLGSFVVTKGDFLDCFGDKDIIGKPQGHLTWLCVKALEKCNTAQRKILELHYGKQDQGSWDLVRNIYQELGLPKEYTVQKEESFKELNTSIGRMSKRLPHQFFTTLAADVYSK